VGSFSSSPGCPVRLLWRISIGDKSQERRANMAGLTTHVLDTANGVPAKGMPVRLYAKGNAVPLGSFTTNADGRCEGPLLDADQIKTGQYELVFEVAAYFRARGTQLSEPPFLDEVRISFGISDPKSHYHVPLLVSPFPYSTYRGS